MKLSALTSQEFGKITGLIKKREEIEKQLKGIESELTRLETGSPVSSVRKMTKPSGKRGSLKEEILRILTDAGSKGLSLQEIVKTVGRPSQTVSVWFYTTGRKVKGLKKVKRGHYAYTA